MKPDYFIINGNECIGVIYLISNHKVIMMYSTIDLERGLELRDMNKKINDEEVEEILKSFMFQK